MESNPYLGNPGLCSHLLVFGIEIQPDTIVDAATTFSAAPTAFSTAPTSLGDTQVHCGKAAHIKFRQKYRIYVVEAHSLG